MQTSRQWLKISLVAWLAFTSATYAVIVANVLLLFITTCLTAWLLVLLAGIKIYGTPGSQGGQAPPLSGGFSLPPRPPDAGKPVPIKPSPRHHLVAAKDLPPSEKTHSLPRD